MGSCEFFAQVGLKHGLQTSASQVTRIIGVSHWHLAPGSTLNSLCPYEVLKLQTQSSKDPRNDFYSSKPPSILCVENHRKLEYSSSWELIEPTPGEVGQKMEREREFHEGKK
jgi:hypothetical protein